MKRQRKQLAIMIGVLVLLGAGYFALSRYNAVQREKEPEPEGEAIMSLEQDEIIRISFDYEDKKYSYEKKEDAWYYEGDRNLKLQPYRLNNIASQFAKLTALDTITGVTDMSQYGLDESARTISVETQAQSYTFRVGDHNDISDVYYICIPDTDMVYTVDSSIVSSLNFHVEEIVEEEESTQETQTESE